MGKVKKFGVNSLLFRRSFFSIRKSNRRIEMGVDTYYLAKQNVAGVGGMFILNRLQTAESSGGGKALLGSVVKENKAPFHKDYPVPLTM
ncbi:MAG: hypothetical protein H0W45_08225, partial [Acidobacteria bacterium]|nr:hypothetical protein [Acidobacteriota bacterium]